MVTTRKAPRHRNRSLLACSFILLVALVSGDDAAREAASFFGKAFGCQKDVVSEAEAMSEKSLLEDTRAASSKCLAVQSVREHEGRIYPRDICVR